MKIIRQDKLQERLQTIDKILLALKAYWRENPELEYKDIIEAVLVELDIEDIDELTDETVEKFLFDSIENED